MLPIYTEVQAKEATLNYFNGDELAADMVVGKYLLKDREGRLRELDPSHMYKRMAKEFARVEKGFNINSSLSESEILNYFENQIILPQGSPTYGIGNDFQLSSLSNCVVVASPEDSISGIMETGRELANLFKRRCGVGVDISSLRPEDAQVSNSAGTSTGAWSFADLFSYICRLIGQNGRRGALMITMDIRHPDAERFIEMKQDKSKVTGANVSVKLTDEFMAAVESDSEFTQQWPCEGVPQVTKVIRARELWDKLVKAATESAEPGLLLWGNCLKYLPAQCYQEFITITTNPCFAGDTLVAVADGRNAVSIKELAEAGNDVPVYSVDPVSGVVTIQWARNPRKTGSHQKLLRVHLDDGSYLDVTPDHKFWTVAGQECLAKDLVPGTSLPRFSKRLEPPTNDANSNYYYRIRCNTNDPTKDQLYEHKLVAKFFQPELWNQTYSEEKANGWHKGGLVVHHKDFDPTNNSIGNLAIMTFKDHATLHASTDTQGEKNGRYCSKTNEEIEELARALATNLGRRFSTEEWQNFAKENGVPQNFSLWRTQGWYENPTALSIAIATELGFEYTQEDPRLVKTYQLALSQGYKSKINSSTVWVTKVCEQCSDDFDTEYHRREQACCSQICSLKKHNSNAYMQINRVAKTSATYQARSIATKSEQARVYSELAFKLGRNPKAKEWEAECASQKVSKRYGTTFGFPSFGAIQKAGAEYNHKVIRVEELSGTQDVYNLTVDYNHTVGIITQVKQKLGVPAGQNNLEYHGVFTAQCGEILLSAYDSCRLICLNLFKMVIDPFTSKATFDWELWGQVVSDAMRLSDNLVELELEKLQQILDKVDTLDEKALWSKLITACRNGRRTGLGTLGLADCLAALGIKYGSEEGVGLTDSIFDSLKNNAYNESAILALERGTFPVYSAALELDHPFITSLDEDVQEAIREYGRRNISILTNAPTGSKAIEAQVSSGIEPVFRNEYNRRKKINHNSDAVPDFIDAQGDKWQTFSVLHHNLARYRIATGNSDTPDYFVTSDQLDWNQRLAMQAAVQRHIDHSVSSTINLPRGTTPETVSGIYMEAWKMGLKGVTVYVDGSRDGVLISNDTHEQIGVSLAPKRPAELPCEIYRADVGDDEWTFLVGLLDSKPYEVFAGKNYPAITGDLGIIQKRSFKTVNAKYDLIADQDIYTDIVNLFDDPTEGTLTRMVSMSLRHGVPVQYVVEQLQKDNKDSTMFSFSKVLARVLKRHIPDGLTVKKSCPECKQTTLVYRDGCVSCDTCSWSKCS